MSRRSPQEKKTLSYRKDHRNNYGETDKSSRRNIRRNKRIPNRVDRHREHQAMAAATGPVELAVAEQVDTELHAKKSIWLNGQWRKYGDAPLGAIVIGTLRCRVERGMVSPAHGSNASAASSIMPLPQGSARVSGDRSGSSEVVARRQILEQGRVGRSPADEFPGASAGDRYVDAESHAQERVPEVVGGFFGGQ